MKAIRFAGTGVLLLLLGITAPIYSHQQQEEKQQEDKNKQQPPKQQQQPKQQEQPKQQQQPPKQQQQPKQQQTQSSGGAYHGGVRPTAPTNGGVHPSGVPQH